jgi:hypothetical protein
MRPREKYNLLGSCVTARFSMTERCARAMFGLGYA